MQKVDGYFTSREVARSWALIIFLTSGKLLPAANHKRVRQQYQPWKNRYPVYAISFIPSRSFCNWKDVVWSGIPLQTHGHFFATNLSQSMCSGHFCLDSECSFMTLVFLQLWIQQLRAVPEPDILQWTSSLLEAGWKAILRPRSHRTRQQIYANCRQIFWCCIQAVWILPLTTVCSFVCVHLYACCEVLRVLCERGLNSELLFSFSNSLFGHSGQLSLIKTKREKFTCNDTKGSPKTNRLFRLCSIRICWIRPRSRHHFWAVLDQRRSKHDIGSRSANSYL